MVAQSRRLSLCLLPNLKHREASCGDRLRETLSECCGFEGRPSQVALVQTSVVLRYQDLPDENVFLSISSRSKQGAGGVAGAKPRRDQHSRFTG